MDIKNFKYEGARGAGKGRAGGVISSEKLENDKSSTHSKIKFYIFFSYDGYWKFYKLREWGRPGTGWFFFYIFVISLM